MDKRYEINGYKKAHEKLVNLRVKYTLLDLPKEIREK